MGANNNSNDNLTCESDKDKEMKKTLLIDTIATNSASSTHEILQQINNAINASGDGSKLKATILSGGHTNYSYKVFVDNHPELCIFAKMCFEYALWNPDRSAHYDLERTENEYEIMKTISTKTPNCVVAPLACWDVQPNGQKMKLILTEWSKADEQFSNQILDGAVDPRIAPKIADTLANLHSIKDFDPNFNELVKPCMENLLEHMKHVARDASKASDPKDRTTAYCSTLGEDAIMKIIDANIANYHQRDCLIHSDSHIFNILVEAKPSVAVEQLETFGPAGTMVLCDWEMAMAGPVGRDIGLALSFPVSCMVAHALNGHVEANESIEAYINSLIVEYCSRMTKAGKTKEEIAYIVRNIAGWCGWFQYLAFYVLNVQADQFPVKSQKSKDYLRDASGILGLKLLRLSYDTNYVAESSSADEIQKMFYTLREDEVARAYLAFTAGKHKMQPRRSSIMRAANRRFSDTEMLYLAAESMKRLSISESSEGMKRVSIAEDFLSSELLQ